MINPRSRSHPGERYLAMERQRSAEVAELAGRARSIEVTRLAVFIVGAVVGLLRGELPVSSVVALGVTAIAAVVFVVLIVRHRQARAALRRAQASHLLAVAGTHRRNRDFDGLREAYEGYGFVDPLLDPLAGADDAHPYAVDLDVLGPASIRALLGPTPTASGSRTLGSWLMGPAPVEEVRRRQGAVRALAENVEAREERTVEALLLKPMDDTDWVGFLEWLALPPVFGGEEHRPLPAWASAVSWLLPAVSLPLFVAWSVSLPVPWWSWGGLWLVQFALTWRWSAALTPFLGAGSRYASGLRGYHALFRAWEETQIDDPEIRAQSSRLQGATGVPASDEIRTLERWLDATESRASMFYHVLSPLIFWDVHVAAGLERWRQRAGASAPEWFEALGRLEALSALATLAADEPEWAFPELSAGVATFRSRGLGHPLLSREERRVADLDLDPPGRFLLVTGSNMSGKSTLLRSIGLAAVLGQTGSVVCAEHAELSSLRTFTSMRIRDSLTAGVSHFMAELLRLKALVDAANDGSDAPLLYLIDEVLQGTNSEERRIAAQRIVAHLLQCDAIGGVTTHDLALHGDSSLDPASTKVHFRETVDPDGGSVLTFDYVLRPGLATSRNALKLLRMVGLDGATRGPVA